MVSLFAAQGKSGYYTRFGFEERPHDAPGMRWVKRDGIAVCEKALTDAAAFLPYSLGFRLRDQVVSGMGKNRR